MKYDSTRKLYMQEWRKKHPNYRKNSRLKKLYGITFADKQKLLEQQNNKCAICQKELFIKFARIDHCHTTGKIRGILCDSCNHGLGEFRDNIENLEKAIEYLIES